MRINFEGRTYHWTKYPSKIEASIDIEIDIDSCIDFKIIKLIFITFKFQMNKRIRKLFIIIFISLSFISHEQYVHTKAFILKIVYNFVDMKFTFVRSECLSAMSKLRSSPRSVMQM